MPDSLEQQQQDINGSFYEQFTPEPQRVAVDGPGYWVTETFDDYVIVGKGELYWMVPFTQVENEITFADRVDWQEVEKRTEWVARVKAFTQMAVKKLSEDDNIAVVGGYGVIFGGRDIQLEEFEPGTEYMLDLVPQKVVTYDHTLADKGQKAIKGFLGHSILERVDDIGIWVELQLDKSKKYVDGVLQLVDKGILGLSSGTAAHLVQMDGHKIKRWPIVEWALTPTPSEPRVLGVERLKQMAQSFPGLQVAVKGSQDPRLATSAGAKYLQLRASAFLLLEELENEEQT